MHGESVGAFVAADGDAKMHWLGARVSSRPFFQPSFALEKWDIVER